MQNIISNSQLSQQKTPKTFLSKYHIDSSAFWSASFVYMLVEQRRTDFAEMFAHHCFTIFLIGSSALMNYWRIGILVLVLHNIADVFLYSAKASKYAKINNLISNLTTSVFKF
jgi:hypothetical protein